MTIQPPGNSEAQIGEIFQSGSLLLFLFLFKFGGALSGSESRCVGHVDAEEKHECLAMTVTSRYPAYTIVLFLVSETALHDRGTHIADDAPGSRDFRGFIFGFWPLADEVGRDAFFGAVLAVFVVGIYSVHPDALHCNSRQFFLIFNTLLKSCAFVECREGMMLDERDAVNLDVVDLGSELDSLVLLATHYRTDIGAVNADDAVFHFFFIEVVGLLTVDLEDGCDAFVLFCVQGNQRGIPTANAGPLSDEFAQQPQKPALHPACG